MNDYLDSRTNANFSGSRQARVDELENELDNVGYQLDGMDHSDVSWEISDDEGDGNQIFVDASLEFSLQGYVLRPHYAHTGNAYVPVDENGNVMTGFQLIPVVEGNVGTTKEVDAVNDFIRDSGI